MLSGGIDEKPGFNIGSFDKGMLYSRWYFSLIVEVASETCFYLKKANDV